MAGEKHLVGCLLHLLPELIQTNMQGSVLELGHSHMNLAKKHSTLFVTELLQWNIGIWLKPKTRDKMGSIIFRPKNQEYM